MVPESRGNTYWYSDPQLQLEEGQELVCDGKHG